MWQTWGRYHSLPSSQLIDSDLALDEAGPSPNPCPSPRSSSSSHNWSELGLVGSFPLPGTSLVIGM